MSKLDKYLAAERERVAGHHEEAVALYREVLQIDPHDWKIRQLVAATLKDAGDLRGALREMFTAANRLIWQGSYDQATRLLDDMLRWDPMAEHDITQQVPWALEQIRDGRTRSREDELGSGHEDTRTFLRSLVLNDSQELSADEHPLRGMLGRPKVPAAPPEEVAEVQELILDEEELAPVPVAVASPDPTRRSRLPAPAPTEVATFVMEEERVAEPPSAPDAPLTVAPAPAPLVANTARTERAAAHAPTPAAPLPHDIIIGAPTAGPFPHVRAAPQAPPAPPRAPAVVPESTPPAVAAAPASGEPALAPATRKVVTLTFDRGGPVAVNCPSFLVGSAPDCNLVLKSRTVSPHHARIIEHDGLTVVKDCGSGKPTLLNGQAIALAVVGHRDTLSFGPDGPTARIKIDWIEA